MGLGEGDIQANVQVTYMRINGEQGSLRVSNISPLEEEVHKKGMSLGQERSPRTGNGSPLHSSMKQSKLEQNRAVVSKR